MISKKFISMNCQLYYFVYNLTYCHKSIITTLSWIATKNETLEKILFHLRSGSDNSYKKHSCCTLGTVGH